MTKYFGSIAFRTTSIIVLVNVIAVLVLIYTIHADFWGILQGDMSISLEFIAKNIEDSLIETPGSTELRLPSEMALRLEAEGIWYRVVDSSQKTIMQSKRYDVNQDILNINQIQKYFTVPSTSTHPMLYGLLYRTNSLDIGKYIEVVTADGGRYLMTVGRDLLRGLLKVGVGFCVVIVFANVVSIRWALRPLRRISKDAEAIGPDTTSSRLTEVGLPIEVRSLVRGINLMLHRLEEGYTAQRNFIADAAHELRTPLAVLRSHIDVLDDQESVLSLSSELGGMERLVAQLLAMARADSIRITADDRVDLNDLAIEIAQFFTPLAIAQGKEIDIILASGPSQIRGLYDPLFRALRNLVENALRYGPPGSTVTVTVTSEPMSVSVADQGQGVAVDRRDLIFKRYWRGHMDRNDGEGAGLGLAIVSSTMDAHGGHISVTDGPAGGALFTMAFPPVHISQVNYPTSGG